MKLIAFLFLCTRLLPSLTQEPYWEEVDCNDEDVFKAVDTALKEYNNRSKSGNQFVLYRITEVNRTLMDDEYQFYSIKYQVKEGDCPVQSGKTWQDCDYKDAEQAATGECSVIVKEKENVKFIMATQTCQITPAGGPVVTSQYDCLGCVHPISTASPDVEPVLRHGIQHFNNHTNHSHLFAFKEIKMVHRQVVAGWNYEITYSIEQTNCSKKNFQFLTSDCKSLPNGDTGECADHAYVDPQRKITSFSQKCDLFPAEDHVPRLCVGCPKEIPVDSPQLEEPLKHSITKLNAENNGAFHFKIVLVKRATSQVVAGIKYNIEFIARETSCSKDKELTEDCEINKLGEILGCTADIIDVPWLNKIESTFQCRSLKKKNILRRPPGFSPFRSVQGEETKEGTTVSPSHTSLAPLQDERQNSEKEQGSTEERGWGHGKQIKHGLGHDHNHEHNQGHGHQRGYGLGHEHQQQHDYGPGHHRELDYNLEHQGRHGLGHGHQREHDLAHGYKGDHGHGHGKHKSKEKENGKHNDRRTMSWAGSPEDTSAQTQQKTERPPSFPSLAQPGRAVALPDFQDLDLIAAVMTNIPPTPTLNDDGWIPKIQREPNSLSFKLIPDFPETSSPKCPGRPWKPLHGMNPTVETKEFHDFDLSDALD